MEDLLIVDGYNVIHAWPDFVALFDRNLEHARDRLVDMLAEYGALRQLKVVIVFDAHMVKGGTGIRFNRSGVEVIYTKEGETADSVIEKQVAIYGEKGAVTVATSDWSQQRFIFGKGAVRMSAQELLNEVVRITTEEKRRSQENQLTEQRFLGSRLSDDVKAVLEKIRRR